MANLPRRMAQDAVNEDVQEGSGRVMRSCEAIVCSARRLLVILSCMALILWSLAPTSSHVPTVIKTLQEHAEMVATHGHSHGLEEDLIWAMHGHNHDVVDHDHSQAIILPARHTVTHAETSADWRTMALLHWSPPHFRLERPPRA